MKKDDFIDVEVKVEPVTGSLSDPRQRALAVRQEKGAGIFEKAMQPEMRGRRASGVVFRPEIPIPVEMRGERSEAAPLIKVPKRAAKSVAEELTGLPVSCREDDTGRCWIEVVFPVQRLEFGGPSWFDALQSLKQHLDRGKR